MLKVLGPLTFILCSQTAFAHDFLRSGKQLLVCEKEEILFRINWEDWDIENKSFGVRSRDRLLKFVLSVDREEAENNYMIESEFVGYEDGKVVSAESAMMSIGPFLGDGHQTSQYFRFHYVDKEKVDAEIQKICKN